MIRGKASGILAALFAAGMITGTVFAEDNVNVEIDSPAVETVSEDTVDTSEYAQDEEGLDAVDQVISENVEDSSEAVLVEENKAEAAEEPEEALSEAVGELAVEKVTVSEPPLVAESTEVMEEKKEQSVPAESVITEPQGILELVESFLGSIFGEKEEVTLIVEHHFYYEQDGVVYDFIDEETILGLEEGEATYDDFDYCDEYECAKCLNGDEIVKLVKGENRITIEYTMADAFMVVE